MKRVVMAVTVMLLPVWAAGNPAGFKAAVELTDSVAIGSPVWVDADGNGVEDLAGYDYKLKRMVFCPRPAEGRPCTGRQVLAGTELGSGGGVFVWDVDKDGRKDLVMQEGGRLLWWRGVAGSPMIFMGTWVEGLRADRWILEIQDMDGDGNADLLVKGEEYVDEEAGLWRTRAPEIGYGNGQGGFEWLKMAEDLPVRWQGAQDVDGDGDLDWAFAYGQVAILQGRSIVRLQAVPDGELVDLDGVPGTELLTTRGIGLTYYGNSEFPRVQVRKLRAGGEWELIADYTPPDFWLTIAPETASAVVGNFDADPEPDILIPVIGGKAVMIGLKPEGLVLDAVANWDSGLRKGQFVMAVKRTGGGLDSLLIQSAPNATDLFGNPVSYGPAHWKRSDVSLVSGYPTIGAQVAVSPFHDPRSFAVVKVGGLPKLASLGGDDRTLSVWAGLTGPAARRLVSVNTQPGISLLAGNFQGKGDELVWMTSNVDFNGPLSLEAKTSYLVAGRPYITDGNGIGSYREKAFNGYLPTALLGAGDFDGDGIDDVLYARSDGGLIWRSGVDPATLGLRWQEFGPVEHQIGVVPLLFANGPLGAGADNYVVRDMDGDGDSDIVQFPSIYGNVAALYTNDGSGHFATRSVGPDDSYGALSITVGNFDGNELPDLVLADFDTFGNGRLRIAYDGGGGAVVEVPNDLLIGKMAAGDFNGDGLDDLALAGGMGTDLFGNPVADGRILTLTRKNATEFGPAVTLSHEETFAASALIAADFNGDGKADLIHGSALDGSISYFEAVAVESWPSFVDWAAAKGVPATHEDTDGDGATNFQEYFSGSDPKVAENSAATGEPGGRPLLEMETTRNYSNSISTLRARQARPAALAGGAEAKVSLEHSPDLMHWQPVTEPAAVRQAKGKPGWEVVEWEFSFYRDETTPRGFYRLRTETTGQ